MSKDSIAFWKDIFKTLKIFFDKETFSKPKTLNEFLKKTTYIEIHFQKKDILWYSIQFTKRSLWKKSSKFFMGANFQESKNPNQRLKNLFVMLPLF